MGIYDIFKDALFKTFEETGTDLLLFVRECFGWTSSVESKVGAYNAQVVSRLEYRAGSDIVLVFSAYDESHII